MPLDRRQLLRGIAVAPLLTRRPNRQADVEELSALLRKAPGEAEAFDVAAEAIRAGASRETFLAAIFLAAAREIRPRPHGILHTVMMIESIFTIGETVTSEREAWLPALFTLHDLKRSQAWDANEGDYVQPAPVFARPRSAEAARAEFLAAMDAWDQERADRALVAFLPHTDLDDLFELLWIHAARCQTYIGHKMILAAQVHRTLKRIGWEHARPALRCVVQSLLWQRDTSAWDTQAERLTSRESSWSRGIEHPPASLELVETARHASVSECAEAVISAVESGLGPRTLWDGLVLTGSEAFARRAGRRSVDGRTALLPVHALTVMSAFRHAWRSSQKEDTRRLLLLQAASMYAVMRDTLVDIVDFDMTGPVPEHPEPAPLVPTLERFNRVALEHHQHKYAGAVIDEAKLMARPELVIAPAAEYLANAKDEETEVYARSEKALG